ncbi:MFS transporter [Frankia sp. AgB1.9]|nr:MFS transporter [Frankia sp. AgW1.1]MBL7549334.1 MFS transporter [Frankia sp. AgB1.9]MBL7619199.1 MFS transporter [Frankia sp. AgB1.8]
MSRTARIARTRGAPSAASPLGALRSPGFRRYLIGQVPSVTGSWAQVVALSWAVVDRDPAALGWVVAAQFTPSLVLGPWFGAVTDRHDRERILMFAEAGLGVVAAAYALASATGHLTLAVIGVLACCWGVLNALDTPARRALVPMLVTPDRSASASALSGMVLLSGMTAGSALGAALVAAAGVTTAFAVNAATFAFDLAVLATIRAGASPRIARAPRQLRDGLAYLRHTPRLRTPLVALAVLATLGFTVQVSVPILVRTVFGVGAGVVGIAFTVVTAGGLVGSVLSATYSGGRALVGAAAGMAASMALTAAAPNLGVALAALAGVGLTWSVFIAATVAILQTAEPAFMGRVMSWLAVVLVGGLAAGAAVAGVVTRLAGGRAPFVVGAVAAIVAAVLTAGPGRAPDGAVSWSRDPAESSGYPRGREPAEGSGGPPCSSGPGFGRPAPGPERS